MEACRKTVIQPNGINILPIDIKVPNRSDRSWSRNPTKLQTGKIRLFGQNKEGRKNNKKQQQQQRQKKLIAKVSLLCVHHTRGVNDDVC